MSDELGDIRSDAYSMWIMYRFRIILHLILGFPIYEEHS
jgi:hypothetical protein